MHLFVFYVKVVYIFHSLLFGGECLEFVVFIVFMICQVVIVCGKKKATVTNVKMQIYFFDSYVNLSDANKNSMTSVPSKIHLIN